MKAKEIRELSINETQVQLRVFKEELMNIQLRRQVRSIEKPSRLKFLKRTIARFKTILKEKESSHA
jgi:large subunit ribosomal protein L29